jgi:tight adherence protein B
MNYFLRIACCSYVLALADPILGAEESDIEIYSGPNPILLALSTIMAFACVFLMSQWLGPGWDVLSQRYIKDITPKLRALGMDEEMVREWMRWWGIGMATTLLVFGVLLQMPTIGLGLVLVLFIGPRFVLDWLIEQRQQKLRDQLVRASMGIANGCRAGLSLPQSIEKIADETPFPLSQELTRIVRYYKGGSRIQESLREVQLRLNLESFTVFASSAIVSLEQGGNIAMALEKISDGLQEMQRLERKLEADSASGRRLALVLGLFPLFFLIMFTLMDPVSMGLLYSTLVGNLILCAVGALVFFAFRWCMAILDLNF